MATWRWFDTAYEAMATGRLDLRGPVGAVLAAAVPDGRERALADVTLAKGGKTTVVGDSRVSFVEAARETRWFFADLQFGPAMTVEGVLAAVVYQQNGPLAAYLPFDEPKRTVDGALVVVVDEGGVLTLGNRRAARAA
jgi:hypothetical protein